MIEIRGFVGEKEFSVAKTFIDEINSTLSLTAKVVVLHIAM